MIMQFEHSCDKFLQLDQGEFWNKIVPGDIQEV